MKLFKRHKRYKIKYSFYVCGFPASRTRSGGDKGTVANVSCRNMGMLKPRLHDQKIATATAKSSTFATAKFSSIYGELVLKRRGLRGMLRLAFTKDLRSTFSDARAKRSCEKKHGLKCSTI